MERSGIQVRLDPLESVQVKACLGKPEGLVPIAPDSHKFPGVLTKRRRIRGERDTPVFPRLVSLPRGDETLPHFRVRRRR